MIKCLIRGRLRDVVRRFATHLAIGGLVLIIVAVVLFFISCAPARLTSADPDIPALYQMDPNPIPYPADCLKTSPPIVVERDRQIIEGLRIKAESGPAIFVSGKHGVTIRNCEILHSDGDGIRFSRSDSLTIENVTIEHIGAPKSGPHANARQNNITGIFSNFAKINRAKLTRGSSGVYLYFCDAATLSFLEGHDFRGPKPRGQLVQLNSCNSGKIEDFSCINPPDTSWPEDIISIFQGTGNTVRRGLVDGNNSKSGAGVMFEGSKNGLCVAVDAINQANGCFSAYPGYNITFRRTRAKNNICTDQGRGLPSSGGLAWAGHPDSQDLQVEDSTYFNLCKIGDRGGLIWKRTAFSTIELTEQDFTPRPPITLSFPWEAR